MSLDELEQVEYCIAGLSESDKRIVRDNVQLVIEQLSRKGLAEIFPVEARDSTITTLLALGLIVKKFKSQRVEVSFNLNRV